MLAINNNIRFACRSSFICTLSAFVVFSVLPNPTVAVLSSKNVNQSSIHRVPTKTLLHSAISQNSNNRSLILGEWAKKGECNSYRHIFTNNRRYQTIQRKQGRWKTFFNGHFLFRESNLVSLGANVEPYEYALSDLKLTKKTLTAIALEEGEGTKPESVSWIRCPNR